MKPSELQKLLNDETPFRLYDVRTKKEFEEIHLPQAELLPLDTIQEHMIEETFDRSEHIVLICKSGVRSEKALQRLKSAGFEKVDVVEGGTDQCAAEGMEVVEGTSTMSLERQVRIAAGSLVVLGVTLALTVHIGWIALSGFVGAGLVFAGITDTCGMGMLLAKAPWNT